MNSPWIFDCKKGLAQGTCASYQADKQSRGYKVNLGGCCSCVHRKSYNEATRQAEEE